MTIYTESEIARGRGALEHAVSNQTDIPGRSDKITPGAAIGILSAAMRSGIPAAAIDQLIDREFIASAPLLKGVLAMYEGNDWDIHLWSLLPNGHYKLCTDLCRPREIGWRYSVPCEGGEL